VNFLSDNTAPVAPLSFGITKAGALAAEAVVFFDPQRAAFMAERRKRAGHFLSKHRFLAAQFAAILADDRWLTLARDANLMADRLSAKLAAVGLVPVWPVEANLVFVVLPRVLDARLKAAGARYYERTNTNLKLHPDEILARLLPLLQPKRMRSIASYSSAKSDSSMLRCSGSLWSSP
jgi:threonine aldolase